MVSSRKAIADHNAAWSGRKRACVMRKPTLIRSFLRPIYDAGGFSMTDVDRAALIELLNRLGSDDDAAVLATARDLHRRVAESGLSWDELLRLGQNAGEAASDELDGNEGDANAASPDDAETMRLIERLLRKDVSADLREDLTEMKHQLDQGALEQDDRRYLRALAKRLSV